VHTRFNDAHTGVLSASGALPPVEELSDADGAGFVGPSAPPGVAAHAAALASLGATLRLRWECFALGRASVAVARALATAAVPAAAAAALTGTPLRNAALVLMDRTGDLVTPSLPSDALLERLAEGAPGGSGADAAAAALAPRCATCGDGGADALAAALALPPLACLCGGGDRAAGDAWEAVLGRRCRDAAMAARKALLEAMRREGMTPAAKPRLGAVAPAELRALATQLTSGEGGALRHRALAAHARAVADAVDAPAAPAADARAAAAKALAAAADAGGAAAVADCLLDLYKSAAAQRDAAAAAAAGSAASASASAAAPGALSLRELFALTLAGYGLAGDAAPSTQPSAAASSGAGALLLDRVALAGAMPPASERLLKDAVTAALAAGEQPPWTQPHGSGGDDVAGSARATRDAVETRFSRLCEASRARRALRATQARSASAPPPAAGRGGPLHAPPGAPPGLVRALAAKIAARDDIPEVRACSMWHLCALFTLTVCTRVAARAADARAVLAGRPAEERVRSVWPASQAQAGRR
jgi:hypothetical protein